MHGLVGWLAPASMQAPSITQPLVIGWVQTPEALQTSLVHALLSLAQAVPVATGEYAEFDWPGSQTLQELLGSGDPGVVHVPLIRQPPVPPGVSALVELDGLHIMHGFWESASPAVMHLSLTIHLLFPSMCSHVPLLLHWSTVQLSPSSVQAVPEESVVHSVMDTSSSHFWHEFAGLSVPLGYLKPLMTHSCGFGCTKEPSEHTVIGALSLTL